MKMLSSLITLSLFVSQTASAGFCEDLMPGNDLVRTVVVARNRETIQKFFANYALAGDPGVFAREQSQLLSSGIEVSVSDHRGTKIYRGVEGYFESLKDWGAVFSTGPDFQIDVIEVADDHAVARLHGKLLLNEPINGRVEIPDSAHAWSETFTISTDGKIARLNVNMNLNIP